MAHFDRAVSSADVRKDRDGSPRVSGKDSVKPPSAKDRIQRTNTVNGITPASTVDLRQPSNFAPFTVHLDLTGWGLSTLPAEVSQLGRLRRLYLSHNSFEVIPLEVCGLVSLEELDMSNNRITQLPRELWRLVNLRRLRLSFNAIRYVPPGMQKLTSLKMLNLFQNELDYIPLELRDMTTLTELYLGNNKLNPSTTPEAADLRGVAGRLKLLPTLANFTRKIDCGFSASVSKMVVVEGTVWAACSDGSMHVVRVSGENVKQFKAHERRIYTLATDGSYVYSAAEDKFVSVWEPKEQSLVCSLRVDEALPVTSISFFEDRVLFGTVGGAVHVARMRRSKKELSVEAKHQINGATVIAVMTRVGDSVWIGSERQILVVLPAAAYKVEASWRAHERVISDLLHVSTSSGSGAVWSCSQDSTIRLWDVKSKQLVHTISQHQSPVNCILPVKNTVWSGSWDKSICIWNTEEPYDMLQELKGRHKDAIMNLIEVNRGKEVWSGSTSLDNSIYIWRLAM